GAQEGPPLAAGPAEDRRPAPASFGLPEAEGSQSLQGDHRGSRFAEVTASGGAVERPLFRTLAPDEAGLLVSDPSGRLDVGLWDQRSKVSPSSEERATGKT